jgi:Helix-turn-helix domain of resolvase
LSPRLRCRPTSAWPRRCRIGGSITAEQLFSDYQHRHSKFESPFLLVLLALKKGLTAKSSILSVTPATLSLETSKGNAATAARIRRCQMLGHDAVGIARIAKETGLTRQTVYRIKKDPAAGGLGSILGHHDQWPL